MPQPNVMGLHEIAARLGISKRYAREVTGRKGFPDPTRLSMGLVWDGADIERWAAGHPEVGSRARGASAEGEPAAD